MKKRLRGNLIIAYNCLKELKDNQPLLSNGRWYKTRGNGQNLQFERLTAQQEKFLC